MNQKTIRKLYYQKKKYNSSAPCRAYYVEALMQKKDSQKIGLMGGTFNPVHFAHLILAEQAREQFELDEVWFLPSGHPPHKPNQVIVSDEHRLNMLNLAIKSNRFFKIETLELVRNGVTYTADTMRELKKRCPDNEFYFIIGGDSLENLATWYQPETILTLSHVVAAVRDDMSMGELTDKLNQLNQRFKSDIRAFSIPNMSISSKSIRRNRKEGNSIRYLLPEEVCDYICRQELYQ